jgi:hypothetical protein
MRGPSLVRMCSLGDAANRVWPKDLRRVVRVELGHLRNSFRHYALHEIVSNDEAALQAAVYDAVKRHHIRTATIDHADLVQISVIVWPTHGPFDDPLFFFACKGGEDLLHLAPFAKHRRTGDIDTLARHVEVEKNETSAVADAILLFRVVAIRARWERN